MTPDALYLELLRGASLDAIAGTARALSPDDALRFLDDLAGLASTTPYASVLTPDVADQVRAWLDAGALPDEVASATFAGLVDRARRIRLATWETMAATLNGHLAAADRERQSIEAQMKAAGIFSGQRPALRAALAVQDGVHLAIRRRRNDALMEARGVQSQLDGQSAAGYDFGRRCAEARMSA